MYASTAMSPTLIDDKKIKDKMVSYLEALGEQSWDCQISVLARQLLWERIFLELPTQRNLSGRTWIVCHDNKLEAGSATKDLFSKICEIWQQCLTQSPILSEKQSLFFQTLRDHLDKHIKGFLKIHFLQELSLLVRKYGLSSRQVLDFSANNFDLIDASISVCEWKWRGVIANKWHSLESSFNLEMFNRTIYEWISNETEAKREDKLKVLAKLTCSLDHKNWSFIITKFCEDNQYFIVVQLIKTIEVEIQKYPNSAIGLEKKVAFLNTLIWFTGYNELLSDEHIQKIESLIIQYKKAYEKLEADMNYLTWSLNELLASTYTGKNHFIDELKLSTFLSTELRLDNKLIYHKFTHWLFIKANVNVVVKKVTILISLLNFMDKDKSHKVCLLLGDLILQKDRGGNLLTIDFFKQFIIHLKEITLKNVFIEKTRELIKRLISPSEKKDLEKFLISVNDPNFFR